ncbi:flagellin [Rhizobium sp. PP-WC-1G-195]|nr:flagellin [Rhizobium sp. PP-WC-1G-195]
MTSILTNTSAMAALQTLRGISSGLSDTQQQVSSGLRVETAADNAAYWSISTTMRSDTKAISAVADALGLGAAKIDVSYTGTTAIIDVLSEFKSRLVAAGEPGVDRSKIQKELTELNKQANSIVASSSFNGVNWLATAAPTHLMETTEIREDLVSSFIRSAEGDVSVGTTKIDLRQTSMLNAGGGGILQKDIWGTGDIGGFRGTSFNSIAHQGHEMHTFTGPATFGTTDHIDFSVIVDAGIHSAGDTSSLMRIDKGVVDTALGKTDGTISNAAEMRAVLNYVFTANSVPATASETLFSGSSASAFEIASLETSGHPGSSIDISAISSTFTGGFALGLENPPTSNHDNMYPQASIGFTKPFSVTGKAELYFDVQVGPSGVQTFTVDRSRVDAALGTTDGKVNNAADLAMIISSVTAGIGLSTIDSGNIITFSADQTAYPEAGNPAARVMVGNVRSNPGYTVDFDLAEIDVTKNDFTVGEYLQGVDAMLSRATNSASTLGAVMKRIDMQTDFTQSLMDTLKKGVGRLVDTDMNEASTRLKALQTQQQLAIQSLQIANSDAQNIMQLFQ